MIEITKISKEKASMRIKELSIVLEMSDYIDKKVGKFSRGMKQKAAIARVIVHNPSVMLLDELLEIFRDKKILL